MKSKSLFILLIISFSVCLNFIKAQVISTTTHPFNYGDGSNGAYNPKKSTTLAGGVYNFTSVNIPSGVTIIVTGTVPLVIRCKDTVTIAGTLSAAGNTGTSGTASAAGAGGAANNGGGQAGGQGGAPSNQGGFIIFGTGPGYTGTAGTNYGSSCAGGGQPGTGGGTFVSLQARSNAGGGGGGSYGIAGAAGAVGDCGGNGCVLSSSAAGGVAGTVYGDSNLVSQCGGATNILGGSGGGGGGGIMGTGSDGEGGSGGGSGGGGIAIIAGSVNITGSINVSGGNGANGVLATDGNGTCVYSGGGGGGTGGTVLLAYQNNCANCTTPYVNINGGTGGTGGTSIVDCNTGTSGAGGNGGQGRFLAMRDICSTPALSDTISNPPAQTNHVGDTVSFTVSPTGTSPFSYQWLKNDTNITNATNSSYVIDGVLLSDSGVYKCLISNLCGSTTADVAHLYVNAARYKFNISGFVRYDNNDTTAMSSKTQKTLTTVCLINSLGEAIDSVYTDSTGAYLFTNLLNGTYKLVCKTNKAWGGVNPIDALLVDRTYIGLNRLTEPLKRLAADVNNDGKINPIDALLIDRRYVHLIHKFTISDWLFQSAAVTVSGADVKKNIKAICAGDVNVSYTPPK